MTSEFNWSWVNSPEDTAKESGSVLQDGGTVYSFRQPTSGQVSASDLNAFSDSVNQNFQSVRSNWRLYTRPILNSLPAGGKDLRWSTAEGKALPDKIDCYKYGVQGTTLFVFNDATADKADGRYWVSDESRPKTIAEKFEDLYSEISDLSDELSVETSVDLDPLWAAIGEDYRDGSKVGLSGSLDNRVSTNEGYLATLNRDIYEPSTFPYSISNPIPYSIADMLNELLVLHNGSGWGGDPSVISHDDYLEESDLSAIFNYTGMTDINDNNPQYSSIINISNGDDLTVAIGKLDAAIGSGGSGGIFEKGGDTGSALHTESSTTVADGEFSFAPGDNINLDSDSDYTTAFGSGHISVGSTYSNISGKDNRLGLSYSGIYTFTLGTGETSVDIPELETHTNVSSLPTSHISYELKGVLVTITGASAANNGDYRILRQVGTTLYLNNDTGTNETVAATITFASGDRCYLKGKDNIIVNSDDASVEGLYNVVNDAPYSHTNGYYGFNTWIGSNVYSTGPIGIGSGDIYTYRLQYITNVIYFGESMSNSRKFKFMPNSDYAIEVNSYFDSSNSHVRTNFIVTTNQSGVASIVNGLYHTDVKIKAGVSTTTIEPIIVTDTTTGDDGVSITEYFLSFAYVGGGICYSHCTIMEMTNL